MKLINTAKNMIKKASIALLIFIILGLALNVIADNPYSQKLARSIVNQSFSQYSDLNISFEAVKVNIFPLGIELFGFSIFSTDDNSTSVKASQIKAQVSIWSLILGDPRLSLIEVSDLDSTRPIPALISSLFPSDDEEVKLSWPLDLSAVPVDQISLRHARIYVELPEINRGDNQLKILRLALGDVNATINIADPEEIKIKTTINALSLKTLEFNIFDSASVDASFTIGPHGIQPSTIKVSSPLMELHSIITGDFIKDPVNNIQSIKVDGNIKGNADLEMLGSILDIEETSGPVTTRGKIKLNIPISNSAPNDDPIFTIDTHVVSKGGEIGGFKLYNSEANLLIDKDKIKFRDLKIINGQSQYGSADGYLTLDKTTRFNFKARPQKMPLGDLLSAVKVDFNGIKALISSPSLTIEGQGTPFRMVVKSIADLNHFEVAAINIKRDKLLPTHCRMNIDLAINSKRLSFDNTNGSCYSSDEPAGPIIISEDAAPNVQTNQILGSSPLKLSGYATFDEKKGMKLNVSSPKLNLPIVGYIFQLPLSGLADTSFTVSGPYNDIGISGTLLSDNFSLSKIMFGRVDASYTLNSKNLLNVKQLRVLTPKNGSIYLKKGMLDLEEDLKFDAEIELSALDSDLIAKISQYLGHDMLKFKVDNATAKLQGPLKTPFSYTGEVAFTLSDVHQDNELLFSEISSEITADKQKIVGKKLNLSVFDFHLTNKFSINKSSKAFSKKNALTALGFNPHNKIIISSSTEIQEKWKKKRGQSSFFIDHLQKLPIVKTYFKQANLKGQLNLDANLQGKLDNLEGKAEIVISKSRFSGKTIAPIKAVAIIEDKNLDVILSHSGRSLEGRLKVDLSKDQLPYSWYIAAKRLDLRAIGSRFFAHDPRNYAYITGNWSMKGDLNDWWNSQGNLLIEDIRLRFMRDIRGRSNTIDLLHTDPIEVSFAKNGWQTKDGKPIKLRGDKLSLNIMSAGNKPPGKLNISFDGHLDLSILRSVNNHIESAEGVMSFAGGIKGSIKNPIFTLKMKDKKKVPGSKDWTPVVIGISDIRPPFTNVKFDINYEDNSLVINSFTADKGEGNVNANGTLYFDGKSSSRVDIAFKNASFVYQLEVLKSFDTEASGNISIVGAKKPYLISGEVQIDRARSTRQFDLREHIIAAIQRKNIEGNVNTVDPVVNFDLRVSAENSIEIYNRNIQAKLSSNVSLSGNNVTPIINGQIEVDRGMFAYKYRRDFQITQGIITFDDPTRPDPRLDILGMSEIGGYRVYMAITGRASDPKVDLSADPPTREDGTPLTKVDILVLMSTGSLPDRQRSDSLTQGAAKTEALNILVGQFEEPVEKLFDLSGQSVIRQVYIDTYADPQGTPTPRLNLPLNLHQDWDVIFRVDGQNNLKVSLGYSVNDHISLSGSFDKQQEFDAPNQSRSNPTDTGVDLKFRFAFP